MINCWYLGEECLFIPPSGYYGYVYLVEVLTDEGLKFYIGKKAFFHSKKKAIPKKRRKLEGTRKRFEKIEIDSQWLDYYGSSKELQEYIEKNGTGNITRRILKLCKSKIDLTYWEIYYLMQYRVLFVDNCFNHNIAGKFYRGKLTE